MIAAFVQARYSSSRLPGKVLKTILGRPMLELQLERLRTSRLIEKVVVVTSTTPDDRKIVELCDRIGVDVFCGSLDNVLDRFYQAALKFRPDHIVRLTGDCPLLDVNVIDNMLRLYLDSHCDYGTNCMPVTYPDGLDAEVFTFEALDAAHREAFLPSHLEHISVFFEQAPERFKTVNQACHRDLSALRWTVDEAEDFEFVRRVFETLYSAKPTFDMDDVLTLLEARPELALLNNRFSRNEGLVKSMEQDKAVLERKGATKP